uniref:Uncharacterized protein n=1 Tax=Opuntia streptacantha TaxID=393608 RepID=A0A7C9AEU0_OPUST
MILPLLLRFKLLSTSHTIQFFLLFLLILLLLKLLELLHLLNPCPIGLFISPRPLQLLPLPLLPLCHLLLALLLPLLLLPNHHINHSLIPLLHKLRQPTNCLIKLLLSLLPQLLILLLHNSP